VTARQVRYSRDVSEFDRAIAFIDATFAVALTFLITTLDVDDRRSAFASTAALANAIGPQFVAFLISFAVIAGYWLMHHRMVAGFVAIDTRTIVVNLCLVVAIVLLPFSTASVGDPGVENLALPTVLMAVNIALVSSLYTLVWVTAARRRLLDHTPSVGESREMVINGLVPAVVFIGSVPLAFLLSPGVAQLAWLSLLVVNPVVGTLTARARRVEDER
jgi:TMEM175 potassium channel family protein